MKRWPMSKLCVVEPSPMIATLPMVCVLDISIWKVLP